MIGNLENDDGLHPYHLTYRQYLLSTGKKALDNRDDPNTNLLSAALLCYYAEGLRATQVGLTEIGTKFFERASRTLVSVFAKGPQPPSSIRRESCDDKELNYHWALAHATRYKTELFLRGRDVEQDVPRGLERMEALLRNTNFLTGAIQGQQVSALWLYFWLGSITRDYERIFENARPFWGDTFAASTRVKGFKREGSFMRLMSLIVRAKTSEPKLLNAARESLAGLLQLYRDLEHEHENLGYWAGPLYGFEWSWVWEQLFEETLDLERAVLRLRVTLPIRIARE